MGKLKIGSKLQKQIMKCPDCRHENIFPNFIDEEKPSNTPLFCCPSCNNQLILKNSNKDMLLGLFVILTTILSLAFLSGATLLVVLGVIIGGFLVLLKKGIIGTSTEFISKNK